MESFAPWASALFLLLVGTAFIKIATVLNALRIGIGFSGIGLGVATTLLSFVLAIALLGSHGEGSSIADAMIKDPASITAHSALAATRPFVLKHTDPKVKDRFTALLQPKSKDAVKVPAESNAGESTPWAIDYAAFIISELRQSFLLACAILIPFLVIDLVVGHLLTLLGVQQLSAAVVAFPIKMLLFVAVDGWNLIIAKVVAGY